MSEATTDHDRIREWAEGKGGKPAAVGRTRSVEDVGLIRVMVPDNSDSRHENLVEIGWDEFFDGFEGRGLAMILDDKSTFSKLVKR